jgi:OOP family OmpA-OmpF porin
MKTKLLLALAASFLISTAAFAASKDAAIDERGAAVRSTNGNCIRTKWNFEDDICAPKKEPEPITPAPAPVVEKAPEPAPAPVMVKPAKELTQKDKTLYFDFDKSDLTDESKAKIEEMAKIFLADKQVESVKIVAYADKMGSTKYNDALSQRRANAVNTYLKDKGYLKTTVAETAWFGDTKPKTECPAKMKRAERIACLQEDRRAEVEIKFYEFVMPDGTKVDSAAPVEVEAGSVNATTPVAPKEEPKTEAPAEAPKAEEKPEASSDEDFFDSISKSLESMGSSEEKKAE